MGSATQSAKQLVVVGGGAAGFFGAIASAEAGSNATVTLLEASPRVLSKVRISGGGRCNVTHACFDPSLLVNHYPRGGRALRGAFTRFQPKDTVEWFQQQGIALKTEADGRMFPTTDDSETIVACLIRAAAAAGVAVKPRSPVVDVTHHNGMFQLQMKSGEIVAGDRLLLATGSSPQGYHLARRLGHTLIDPVPSLFTFTIPDADLRALAGVAVETAEVQLANGQGATGRVLPQTGAVLITHWGLSGPAILKLSAWGARVLHDCGYQTTLRVNWLPTQSDEAVRQALLAAKAEMPKRAIAAHSPLGLPRRLWHYLVQCRSAIAAETRWADCSKRQLQALSQAITRSEFSIHGKSTFKDEFVTCGGIALNEVNFKTMESRQYPGLYLAGELLDIDGVTGGFNFQSAWTTGWLAGQAMGQVD